MNEEEEAQARAEADKLYFAQKKSGTIPTKKPEDTDELITFVEDGLNRPNVRVCNRLLYLYFYFKTYVFMFFFYDAHPITITTVRISFSYSSFRIYLNIPIIMI